MMVSHFVVYLVPDFGAMNHGMMHPGAAHAMTSDGVTHHLMRHDSIVPRLRLGSGAR